MKRRVTESEKKKMPRHMTYRFDADVKNKKVKCEQCKKKFEAKQVRFTYGTCDIQLCKTCYMDKLR